MRPTPLIHGKMLALLGIGLLSLSAGSAIAAASSSVYLEDLTTSELQSRIKAGTTTALVPIGGTEQSGPHIALGKHNVRVHDLAGKIAQALGNTVVAPVMAYVPEGSITPPSGHMRLAGTLSIDDSTFEALLNASAKSLCQHGLTSIVFLGDHGGYQKNMVKVAAQLNQSWSKQPAKACRAHALTEYYESVQAPYVAELKRRGYSNAEIGLHAGLADTSLMLAVDPGLVRTEQLQAGAKAGYAGGVQGDPSRATAALGQIGITHQIDASVAAIRAITQHSSSQPR
ncbi:MAG TPA: creatininase family protein [Limnobacter sp.]|uniref:creatininase family protein n=1 Tax=Limnobacter sp. TaxID=2003368 RepID=UPI002ED7F8CD